MRSMRNPLLARRLQRTLYSPLEEGRTDPRHIDLLLRRQEEDIEKGAFRELPTEHFLDLIYQLGVRRVRGKTEGDAHLVGGGKPHAGQVAAAYGGKRAEHFGQTMLEITFRLTVLFPEKLDAR